MGRQITISILLEVHGVCFSRMRILAGGQVLEDIDDYNRVHEMFQVFSATDSRQNDYGEGFWQLLAKRNLIQVN